MKKCLLLLALFFSLFVQETSATHMMGADITYKCLGNNQYRITIKVYRDCTGIALNGITGTVSSGSFSTSFSPTKIGVRDVTPSCIGAVSACENRQSGLGIGVEIHTFQDTIDISKAPFNTWIINGACEFKFGWGQCCRNSEITTINNGSFYTDAMLNVCNIKKTSKKCNDSPILTSDPIAFICCNNPFYFNNGALDSTDYDSLSYSLVAPQSSRDTNMTHKSPFDPRHPMTCKCIPPGKLDCTPDPKANPPLGFYLDYSTGDIAFTPTKCDEVGIVVMEIKEWRKDTTGKFRHIGTTKRDMQFIVMNCGSNWPPSVTSSKYDYTVCEGDQIKITIDGKDQPHPQDPNGRKDTVELSWNNSIAQGAFKVTNPKAREKKAEFIWQTKIGDAKSIPYTFTVTATDDACPLKANSIKGFSIKVLPRAFGKRTYSNYCGINGLEVDFALDSNFNYPASHTWTLLDSNSTIINSSSTKRDTFIGLSNGRHYVQLKLNNKYACSSIFIDTVDLSFVTNGKSLNLGKDTTITDKDSLTLDAGTSFKAYTWNDNSRLQKLLIQGSLVGAGKYNYWVKTTDSSGCNYLDSIQVTITSTIGINDWNKEKLLLYPSPTSDFLTLEFPKEFNSGDLEILNSTGQVVMSNPLKLENSKSRISVSQLPNGIYFLKVKSEKSVLNASFIKE